jgi:hypothetical protein
MFFNCNHSLSQMIKKILRQNKENILLHLLCSDIPEDASSTARHILNKFMRKHSNFKVTYCNTVTKHLIQTCMPHVLTDETMIYVYGPPEFLNLICGDKTADGGESDWIFGGVWLQY